MKEQSREVDVYVVSACLKVTDYQAHVINDLLSALQGKWEAGGEDWKVETRFLGTWPIERGVDVTPESPRES